LTAPNSLLIKDIEIKIDKFTKKEGGLFSQSYVCYTVYTQALNVRVERRYNDFWWLKKNLELLHPGMPVPPIAKKGQFRRYDDKHLWKRAMILEMFLNKLMEIPELKAEAVVENFLKIADRAGW
jgi:sorting nexin-7/30